MLWQRVLTLIVVWIMAVASLWVLLQLGLINVASDDGVFNGKIFGLEVKLVGGGALLAIFLVLLVFLLGKIPTTAAVIRAFFD